MNNKINTVFQLQTNILLNYVFIKLITFFMNPEEQTVYLYETILPTKKETLEELSKKQKTLPKHFKYKLYLKCVKNELDIILKQNNVPDITVCSAKLLKNPPTIQMLKLLANILVQNYRPLPTKVDKEFSILSVRYFNFLNYNKIQRQWNSGISRKEKIKPDVQQLTKKELNILYNNFISDISKLQLKYRAFAKILLDMYQSNSQVQYLTKSRELTSTFIKKYGISLVYTNFNENRSCNELIKPSDFYPSNHIFTPEITNTIISCVQPELTKLYH